MKRFAVLLLTLAFPLVQAADYQVGERLNAPKTAKAERYREVTWDDLLPEGWNPMQAIKELKLDQLEDSDPRAMEAMEQLKAMWNDAPTNPAITGRPIRIPGFMVPLEFGQSEVKEFLLVPYFGACIHVPPPPANQVIHVLAAKPVKTKDYMDAVWIEGQLELATVNTEMGSAGYRMAAARVTPYKE
jgi:hypothetical protein